MLSTMIRTTFLLAAVALVIGTPVSKNENTRIVGGHDTAIEDTPWQAAVLFVGEFLCGGTILTERYVATAASCTKDPIVWAFSVSAGSNIRKSPDAVEIPVVEIHENPYYVDSTHDGDISIVELESPFVFSPKIKAIKLPQAGVVPKDGTVAIVSGWGLIKFDGPTSKILQSVDVPLVNHGQCETIFEGRNPITANMICAGYVGSGGKDSCEFDTGGPLTVDGTLVGLVSWGLDCAHPKYPGVYTNVAQHIDFIKRIISK